MRASITSFLNLAKPPKEALVRDQLKLKVYPLLITVIGVIAASGGGFRSR